MSSIRLFAADSINSDEHSLRTPKRGQTLAGGVRHPSDAPRTRFRADTEKRLLAQPLSHPEFVAYLLQFAPLALW